MLINMIKNFIKRLLRPIMTPFLSRIRSIVREELLLAQTKNPAIEQTKAPEKSFAIAEKVESPAKKPTPKLKVFYREKEVVDIDTDPRNIVRVAKEYLQERCSKRKLLIYGTGSEALKLNNLLSVQNLHVEYFIDDVSADTSFENKKVKSYFDIVYENPGSIFIIIANENEDYGISRQKFIQLGLMEDIDFTYYKDVSSYAETFHYDVTLSYNRKRGQIEGFEIFGDVNNPDALKIVALGGSTTESVHSFIKGWPQMLTDSLAKDDHPTVMYCGGIAGYTSSQELLKLIRDVLPLKPDIVISYSGYNDLSRKVIIPCPPERERRPFITDFQVNYIKNILLNYPEEQRMVYYGLENDKKALEQWLDNIRSMRSIANEFNILFLSFLQPFYLIGGYKPTDSQKTIFNRKWWNKDYPGSIIDKRQADLMINGAQEMINAVRDIDYITDLTNIFSEHENIYRDIAHVTEYGNQVIADHVYKELLRHIDGGKSK